MAVRIDKIKVNNLGPLPEFEMDLGAVNLIYARNEQGKTHLVEFLIRSLFKKPGFDNLRPFNGRGEVRVSGLSAATTSFTGGPRSRKLEEFLQPTDGGLPASIARMLIVRAGDVAVAKDGPGGVSRAILKEYLSNEGFLDEIKKGIQKTTQDAQLDASGRFAGRKAGDIGDYEAKKEQLAQIDGLFARLQDIYSGGQRAILAKQLKDIQMELERLETARRHRAWELDQDARRMEADLKQYPRERMETLQSDVRQYQEKKQSILEKQKLLEEKESACEHYAWLVQAVDVYKSFGGQNLNQPSRKTLLLIAGCLLIAVVGSFLRQPLVAAACIALAAWFGWQAWRTFIGLLGRAGEVKEKEDIAKEFEVRFGVPCSGLPLLEERKKKLDPEWAKADLLRGELVNDRRVGEGLRNEIGQHFLTLPEPPIDEEHWSDWLRSAQQHCADLQGRLSDTKEALIRLGVTPDIDEPADMPVKFDPARYECLQKECEATSQELSQENAELLNLKTRIMDQTGDRDITIDWEILIQKLKLKRAEIAQQAREKFSQIAAGILVNEALVTLRQQENDLIRERLQNDLIRDPLKRLTGKYEQVDLEEDQLMVYDGLGRFALSELSTGAQEQVLLALRIAFSRKVFGQDALFLILDDAFQHSDWQRRERLVAEMVSVAQQGWQIIYFTMDDHIRDLFHQLVRPEFNDQYCFRDLSANVTVGS